MNRTCHLLVLLHNLGQKTLDLLPLRVLWFRLCLMGFQCIIHHVPGKSLYTADTLSQAPLNEVTDKSRVSSSETEQFVQAITVGLLANADHLEACLWSVSSWTTLLRAYSENLSKAYVSAKASFPIWA